MTSTRTEPEVASPKIAPARLVALASPITLAVLVMFSNFEPSAALTATAARISAEDFISPDTVRFFTVPFTFSKIGAETVMVCPLPSRIPAKVPTKVSLRVISAVR